MIINNKVIKRLIIIQIIIKIKQNKEEMSRKLNYNYHYNLNIIIINNNKNKWKVNFTRKIGLLCITYYLLFTISAYFWFG